MGRSDSIVTILSNRKLDDPYSAKGCLPTYGVRMTFQKGEDSLHLYFCFECDLITTTDSDEKMIAGGDFDPAHNQLATLVKEVFPDNKKIQNIE